MTPRVFKDGTVYIQTLDVELGFEREKDPVIGPILYDPFHIPQIPVSVAHAVSDQILDDIQGKPVIIVEAVEGGQIWLAQDLSEILGSGGKEPLDLRVPAVEAQLIRRIGRLLFYTDDLGCRILRSGDRLFHPIIRSRAAYGSVPV